MYGFKYVIFNEQNIFACIICIYKCIYIYIYIYVDIDIHARSCSNQVAALGYTRQI